MRKGRHRKRREARQLKMGGGSTAVQEPCVECGRLEHADWCMADELGDDFDDDVDDEFDDLDDADPADDGDDEPGTADDI